MEARMTTTITYAEILDALQQAGTAPADAMTMTELADATGFCRGKVRQDLGKLQREGRLLVHRVRRQKLDGNTQVVPAYTIAPKGKKR